MKSILTIIALTLIFSPLAFSQDRNLKEYLPNRLNEEKKQEIFNPISDGYNEFGTKDSRITINKTQLENGFILSEQISKFWVDSIWVNNYKKTFTYDGNNNLIEILFQKWINNNWINYTKTTYNYDANNYLIEWLYQDWVTFGSKWVNHSKGSLNYDGNNNLLDEIVEYWSDTTWENGAKLYYSYDSNNNITEVLFQPWNGSTWVNGVKYLNAYDENNNLVQVILDEWHNSVWIAFYRELYTYDENDNRIEELYQDRNWVDSTWVNHGKFSFTYDANNNLIERLDQFWDNNTWIICCRILYSNDLYNNKIEELYQDWYNSNWVDHEKVTFNYIPITLIENELSFVHSYFLSNNYPNPFNPSTSIQYAISTRQFVQLKVYDVLGIEIETLVNEEKSAGKYEINWNATNLPSGVYFYRLQAGDFVQTNKMILLK